MLTLHIMYLQVMCLDSLDLGPLNRQPGKFPRISMFDCEVLNKMISAYRGKTASKCSSEHTSFTDSRVRTSTKTYFCSPQLLCCFVHVTFILPIQEDKIADLPKKTSSFETNHLAFHGSRPAVSSYLDAYGRGCIDPMVCSS